MEEEKLSGAALGARLVELYGNEKAVESFKKKLTFGDFASKDGNRLFMTGVFYEKGFAVATDGRVLLKQKADYPKEWEGKIVSLSDGKEIKDCEFPNYKRILDYEGRYDSRQELLGKDGKFLEASVALVGAGLDGQKKGSRMVPVCFGDASLRAQAANPMYLANAIGWAQTHGYDKCEQLVRQSQKRDENYNDVVDENGKPVMEDVYGQLRFSAPDGSELVLMPLNGVDGSAFMSKGAVLKNLSNENSEGAALSEIQAKALGKGEDLYRGIAEEWLSKQGVSLKDAEKSFSDKLSKAKEKGKLAGFPVKREDCLAVAAAWTVAEGLGEKIGESGFGFAPGESQISLDKFVAEMYLDKIRRIAKTPERLFNERLYDERLEVSLLDEAKSGGLLMSAPAPEERALPGFEETEEPDARASFVPLDNVKLSNKTEEGRWDAFEATPEYMAYADVGNGKFAMPVVRVQEDGTFISNLVLRDATDPLNEDKEMLAANEQELYAGKFSFMREQNYFDALGGSLKEMRKSGPLQAKETREAPAAAASKKVPLNGILNAMELMCSATSDGKYKLYDWGNGKFILGKDGAETFDDARGLLEAAERNLDDFYGRKIRAALGEARVSVPDGAGLKELCSVYRECAKDASYGLDAGSFFFNNALAAANPELCEMPEYEATMKIKGEVWKVRDVEEGIKWDVERLFKEWDSGDKERNLVLTGVRIYGDLERNLEGDGDVKVLVEFESKNPENRWSEDSVFNALAEEGLEIGGVKIDFNPITPEKSGTISEYLARLEELGAKTEAQAIKKLDGMIKEKEAAEKPALETKPAAGKKERRTSYKGLRFFDRNYSEADEFLKYFNSVKRPGAPDMTASDAEAVLRALDHFNVGDLRGRSERLALNESDELVFVTRDEAGLSTEKTSPQGVITRAAEKAVRERDQMRANIGSDAGVEAVRNFAASFLKSYEDQAAALSEIKERLVGSAEGMELKAGQTLAGKPVSDAFQIGSGVWQADFGKPSAKDARLVLTKSAMECVPEPLRGCFSQDGEYFVMENKFADPYVYKALVESGRVMPRDENYMEMLSAHVKKYPAKYLPLYPVTKESFGDCMRKLSKIDGTTDPLELSNKLLKLVMPSKVTELHKWIGKMSEVSPGVRSEARLKSFLSEMLAGAERKREKARAGGYPPRGE